LNEPRWRDQYGDGAAAESRFAWTRFYEAIADALLKHRHDRTELVRKVHAMGLGTPGAAYFTDLLADGSREPLRDICPFTVMGTFNRAMTIANRRVVATELARTLDVVEPVPSAFDGVPRVNNQASWFFSYAERRAPTDIETLWAVFDAAHEHRAAPTSQTRADFVDAYDAAVQVRGTRWNLSVGLFWSNPWTFVTLDGTSREFIESHLRITVPHAQRQNPPSGEQYMQLVEALQDSFADGGADVASFPELSLAAWEALDRGRASRDDRDEDEVADEPEDAPTTPNTTTPAVVAQPLSLDDVVNDGCFVDRHVLEAALSRLRQKKNLILQGPPGTGKTWLARRLGYALIGSHDPSRLRSFQFHPNLSYEDFVRGFRPDSNGRLTLRDGLFLEAVRGAHTNHTTPYVVVIEEINRGNPAQVFGELLTLLEADKRSERDAISLGYQHDGEAPFFLPPNLHVIGTMNIADRSLALVDLALRRRFAFVELEPQLGGQWRDWVTARCGLDHDGAARIQRAVGELNERIAADSTLGRQFRIGHSYFTPGESTEPRNARSWFREVVETEIAPLLDEYFYDAPDKAASACKALLEGW
jgi:5-methylcytosine-specific restriction protein B